VADYNGTFSGSYEGDGSQLKNIDYFTLSNLPKTITNFDENSIRANSAFRDLFTKNVKTRLDAESVISSSTQLHTDFDIRYGNEEGDGLVSGSAQIQLVVDDTYMSASLAKQGFGKAGEAVPLIWKQILNVPGGIVSSSAQSIANLVGSNLVVDSITANTYIISSSVTHMTTSFSSGSTVFGDDITDTHQITGSLSISGSINFVTIDGGNF